MNRVRIHALAYGGRVKVVPAPQRAHQLGFSVRPDSSQIELRGRVR